MTNRTRQPAGRPTGGQFAPEARPDASVSLDVAAADPEIPEVTVAVDYQVWDENDNAVRVATHSFDLGPYIAQTPPGERFTEFAGASPDLGGLDYWVGEAIARGDLPPHEGPFSAYAPDLEDLVRRGDLDDIPVRREPKVFKGVPLDEPLTRQDALAEADENGNLTATVKVRQDHLLGSIRVVMEDNFLAAKLSPLPPHDVEYKITGVEEDGTLLVEVVTNVGAAALNEQG